jgi:hypothetical protein
MSHKGRNTLITTTTSQIEARTDWAFCAGKYPFIPNRNLYLTQSNLYPWIQVWILDGYGYG